MKVLTFCAYFEPEIAASMYLTLNLLEGMANKNIEVDVFAPTPTRGISKETVKKYKKIKHEDIYGKKIHINRFAMFQEGKNTIGRAIRYILINIAFIWKGMHSNADVMFVDSTPPTQGVMAALLKKIKKIPIVYNLQDVFPDSMVHAGMTTESSLIWKIGRKIENYTYKNADKIIAISEDMKQNIIKKGVSEDKIIVVPNWVDTSRVYPIPRNENKLFDKYKLDRNKFYVSYNGNIGLSQNLDIIIEAAQYFKKNNADVQFVFFGEGAAKDSFIKKIDELHLNNIKVFPFQDYLDIAYVFSVGDVGIIISKGGTAQNSVPSKTWSYMSAGKPIIASFDIDSELSSLIEKIDCGNAIPADNSRALINTIEIMVNQKEKNIIMGNNGRNYVKNELDKTKCVDEYINILLETRNKFSL